MRVHELLDHWADRFPDEIYVSDGNRSLTWNEMREWTHRVGNWLADTLQPGDRFCMLDRNSLEMISLYFGASRAGVVPVPLNFRRPGRIRRRGPRARAAADEWVLGSRG
ncbi:AMP-binding protein, partial [Rhodococcus oxybenzonivorans]